MSTTPPPWEIWLLGGLRVRREGADVHSFGGQKNASLLAMLAFKPGRPRRREELMEALWPGVEPEVGRNRLSVGLSWLRRILEGPSIARGRLIGADRGAVWLERDAAWVDVVEFERLLTPRSDLPRVEALSRAITLYGGALLPEGDEQWITAESTRLDQRLLNACLELAALQERRGEAGDAIETLLKAVAVDPSSIPLGQALLKLYRVTGRAQAGVEQARAWERSWLQATGRAVPQAMKALRQALEAEAAAPPAPPPAPPVSQPASPPPAPESEPLTRFFGREAELATLADLTRHGARLITILGPTGVGKTRLLPVAARRVFGAERPVTLVALADLRGAEHLDQALAQSLGIADASPRALDEALTRPRALMFDGFERHVEAGAPWLSTLLRRHPELLVWVTSQRPLELTGEVQLPIRPLAVPPADAPLDQLMASDAIRLFADRAQASSPGFGLNAGNAARVAEICRRLDGLPLAVELAAARVGLWSVEEIQSQLSDRFRLLRARVRDGDPRHRSLEAAIAANVELLAPELRALLAVLSIFPADFDVGAAEAVSGDELCSDRVAELATCSLVVSLGEDHPRYRLLESLRAYAARALDPVRAGPVRARYEAWYLDQARRCTAAIGTLEHPRLLQRVLRDWAHYQELLATASAATRAELVVALDATALGRGRSRELVAAIDALLPGPLSSAHRVHLLTMGAMAARDLGDSARAARYLDDLGSAELDDLEVGSLARALGAQANFAIDLGALDSAEALARRACHVTRDAGMSREPVVCSDRLGRIEFQRGSYASALRHLEAAERGYEALFDVGGVLRMGMYRAIVHLDRGDPEAAAEALPPTTHAAEAAPLYLMLAPIAAGHIALERGRSSESRALLEGVLAELRTAGVRRAEAFAQQVLAMTSIAEGRPELALPLAEASAAGFRAQGVRVELPLSIALAGLARLGMCDPDGAEPWLREAASLLAPASGCRFVPLVLEIWAELHEVQGEGERALGCLATARALRMKMDARPTWERAALASLRQERRGPPPPPELGAAWRELLSARAAASAQ